MWTTDGCSIWEIWILPRKELRWKKKYKKPFGNMSNNMETKGKEGMSSCTYPYFRWNTTMMVFIHKTVRINNNWKNWLLASAILSILWKKNHSSIMRYMTSRTKCWRYLSLKSWWDYNGHQHHSIKFYHNNLETKHRLRRDSRLFRHEMT